MTIDQSAQVFHNGEFELPLVPDENGSFRVYAPLLAKQLGYRAAHDMVRDLDDDEKALVLAPDAPAGSPPTWYLTTSGAYRLLMRCKLSRIPDPTVRRAVEEFQRERIREGSAAAMSLLDSLQDIDPIRTASISRIDQRPVYLIRDAVADEVKIGVSQDPSTRLRAIQATRPNPLELALVIPTGGVQLERRLHGKFAKYRLYSEWFRAAKPLREFIRKESRRSLSVVPPADRQGRADLVGTMREIGEPQAQQYQLTIFSVEDLRVIEGGAAS